MVLWTVGICHYDLKCDNVFLLKTGIFFSIARYNLIDPHLSLQLATETATPSVRLGDFGESFLVPPISVGTDTKKVGGAGKSWSHGVFCNISWFVSDEKGWQAFGSVPPCKICGELAKVGLMSCCSVLTRVTVPCWCDLIVYLHWPNGLFSPNK
jgi:hypothetical protein